MIPSREYIMKYAHEILHFNRVFLLLDPEPFPEKYTVLKVEVVDVVTETQQLFELYESGVRGLIRCDIMNNSLLSDRYWVPDLEGFVVAVLEMGL